MGAFDCVICHQAMPDGSGEGSGRHFQTKEFIGDEHRGCMWIEIAATGHLIKRREGLAPSREPNISRYSGSMEFYDDIGVYVATFADGALTRLETLEQWNASR